jgi:hypothetical protein
MILLPKSRYATTVGLVLLLVNIKIGFMKSLRLPNVPTTMARNVAINPSVANLSKPAEPQFKKSDIKTNAVI